MYTGKSIPLLRFFCWSTKLYSIKCGMIYRRVTEVTEVDQPAIPGLPNYWSQRPSFGRSGFNNQLPTLGPFLKRKRTMDSWEELSLSEEVRNFKRVRILSNIKKARKAAFALWEDKTSWGATEIEQINTIDRNDSFEAKATLAAEFNAGLRNLPTESTILSGASFYPRVEDEYSEEKILAHTRESEKHDTSGSEEHILRSGEGTHHSKQYHNGHRHLARAREDENDEGRLVPFLRAAGFKVPDDDEYRMSANHRSLCYHYAKSLNAKRAQLLELLPGGPILASISEPLCQLLDIGPPNAWLFMGKLIALIHISLFSHSQAISWASMCYLRLN